ncbi:MAG: AtpZ/AtpI family protein [Deltaproteobacteria bacterium]|nr:AtpZ/AtpI family protein [Deltaproteobacteria bacterium]
MADERPPSDAEKRAAEVARTADAYRSSQPYFDAVWRLVGGVGVGVGGGYMLDKWLNTTPWLLVAGSVVGMTAGFIGFFQSITRASQRK